ncbi:phosphoglycerate dehydrogenase [Candidatus Poribacteria bacterium]|nr:phosphoglycerate dehydrogenase [Candidatus Poribacteria bacterium]
MTYRVLVSDKLSEDGLEVLRKAGFEVDHLPEITQQEILGKIGGYDAWVVRSRSKATAEILEKGVKLRVVGRAGVGVDNVDVTAASRMGIIVMNTPGGNTISTAEHTIAMIMALSRKIPAADSSMHAGKWDKKSFMGVELNKKTLGVIGMGRIGQEVAKRMRAFGMTVMAFDPFVAGDRMKQTGAETATVDEICRSADFITVHTPLSPETKHLINAERIGTMKKGVRIVNCARGGIVDEKALAEALTSGKVAGAALDVFESEPLAADHPLLKAPNVVLTPHIAASTVEAQENVAIQVAEQIVDLFKNNNVHNAVNAPSVDPEVLRVLAPYLRLCEKLGKFSAQFCRAKVKRITCKYSGAALHYPTEPLTTAFAKGWIEPSTDRPVNYVNALPIVHERGIEVLETRRSETDRFTNLMTIVTEHEDGAVNRISGSVFEPDHGRIVMVNDKTFAAIPRGNLVVIENQDVPGIIGTVGTFFGNRKMNIAEMTWGRREEENLAMTIINVDGDVTEAMLDEIRKLPNIVSARLIKL